MDRQGHAGKGNQETLLPIMIGQEQEQGRFHLPCSCSCGHLMPCCYKKGASKDTPLNRAEKGT